MTLGSPPLIVWYNTKCPVCRTGIDWQRNKLARAARSGAIPFRDINDEPGALASVGATGDDVRRRLYAKTPDGQLHIGADAAIEIWRATPGQTWLAQVISLPGIRSLARFSYNRFATVLFAWNKWRGNW
jgi:predicted DCC family thiol-disulfide oxidoreductase YuxK